MAAGDRKWQAVRGKIVVGVVGATGAGKSSVINAMLDEERLVPTNCMRACTAVVTEISYNQDKDSPYYAEIEFIKAADWEKEVGVLFQDLLNSGGEVAKECNNEDSEAGIAYAKLKAVYPKLTKEDLAHTSVEHLMAHENIVCLGSLQIIRSQDSLAFYKKLQAYVDSKEKTSQEKASKEKTGKDKQPQQMEFWPLIRVVRLYVKAPALSTGAVIVDLPGVHDSNQARAAVAQSYLKQCTGLWIVAPITRAVDDKSAKTLLGDSFRRQLKMDGGYSSVTFICTKTDDISLTEAHESLSLEEEFQPLYRRHHELVQANKAHHVSLVDLKAAKSSISAALESAEEEADVCDKLQEDLHAGVPAYRPQDTAVKRKRAWGSLRQSRKKKRSTYAEVDSDNEFVASDSEDDSRKTISVHITPREVVTEQVVATKIAELRATKKNGRREKARLDEQLNGIRQRMQQLDEEIEDIDAQLAARCISGRNEYSRRAIQMDFAAGVKELDEELAQEEDAANFDPEVDARDYEEVARSLSVFCVSSRAFQKLQGRLQKDKAVPGFQDLEETEVPAMQRHCEKLTEASRQSSAKTFINKCASLLNSLHLWASSDGSGRNLTEGQLTREAETSSKRLNKLDKDLDKCVRACIGAVTNQLEDNIYDILPQAAIDAKNQANASAESWSRPINRANRANGGLYCATYKAVCRRNGSFSNRDGLHDFNGQLTQPIIRSVTGPWDRMFSRRLPLAFTGLPTDCARVLTAFHDAEESRAVKKGLSAAPFSMLKAQIPHHLESFKGAAPATKNEIVKDQKDINRGFVPTIANNMMAVCGLCSAESGQGVYARIKAAMASHVENKRGSMFEDSTKHVLGLLKNMVKEAEDSLSEGVDEVFLSIKRDYTRVVVGGDAAANVQLLPREQRVLRESVLELLNCAEAVMQKCLVEDLEMEDGGNIKREDSAYPDHEVARPSTELDADQLLAAFQPKQVAQIDTAKAVDDADKENNEVIDRPTSSSSRDWSST